MGGSGSMYKGNGSSRSGRSSSSSSSSFRMVLLLAFVAALVGVMVVHKLRERRIFNLVVKDKDTEISSLHLLLQREKEYNKEMKRKNEELRRKFYVLRTQNMELDRRVLEMQSSINSLKDEHKAFESALEEKQNEIRMLSGSLLDSGNINPQLTERLDQKDAGSEESKQEKDADIADLKPPLENTVKVWSVITDDPSNPRVNLTGIQNMVKSENTEVKDSREEDGHKSTIQRDTDASAEGDNGAEIESANLREADNKTMAGVQNENIVDSAVRNNMTVSEQSLVKRVSVNSGNDGAGGEQNPDHRDIKEDVISSGRVADRETSIVSATNAVGGIDGEVIESEDETNNVKATGAKKDKIVGDRQLDKSEGSQEGQENSTAGVKLEVTGDSGMDAGLRLRRKHGRLSRRKVQRWRALAKNRRLDTNEQFHNNELARPKRYSKIIGGRKNKGERSGIDTDKNINLLDSAERDDGENRKVDGEREPSSEKENEKSEKLFNSPDREVLSSNSIDGLSGNSTERADDRASHIATDDKEHESNAKDEEAD